MEKLNVGVANRLAVAGINNLHVNDEIDTRLILTYVCTDHLALDIYSGLAVVAGGGYATNVQKGPSV
jgi:hypothetical protein